MKYTSTRGQTPAATLSEAIPPRLASDGGLYAPDHLPQLRAEDFPATSNLAAVAKHLLTPFFEDDALAAELLSICAEAFTFPAPLKPLATPHDHILYHYPGPT